MVDGERSTHCLLKLWFSILVILCTP